MFECFMFIGLVYQNSWWKHQKVGFHWQHLSIVQCHKFSFYIERYYGNLNLMLAGCMYIYLYIQEKTRKASVHTIRQGLWFPHAIKQSWRFSLFINICNYLDVSQGVVEYAKKELKLVFLELNWEDSTSYIIKEEDLVQCARFIHQARGVGGTVLVHCAQVNDGHI